MKIATWNIERPTKTTLRNKKIIEELNIIAPDILILTESNEAIHLGNNYQYHHTTVLDPAYYKEGEKRVSIYSKYKLIETFQTFRGDTSLCIHLETPLGNLAVYGTVIGVYGNRRTDFTQDLHLQLLDFNNIAANNLFCIAGDLNMSFSDNYYHTKIGRDKLNESFNDLNLHNTTAGIPQNIDHIILSNEFIKGRELKVQCWNLDKKLSDHIGLALEIL